MILGLNQERRPPQEHLGQQKTLQKQNLSFICSFLCIDCMYVAHLFPVLFSSAAFSSSAPYSTGWAKFACKYLLNSLFMAMSVFFFFFFFFSPLHSFPVASCLFTLCSPRSFIFLDFHSTKYSTLTSHSEAYLWKKYTSKFNFRYLIFLVDTLISIYYHRCNIFK